MFIDVKFINKLKLQNTNLHSPFKFRWNIFII